MFRNSPGGRPELPHCCDVWRMQERAEGGSASATGGGHQRPSKGCPGSSRVDRDGRWPCECNDQGSGYGYLIKQNYREGEFVKKDQVLFEIDPRPFQVALDQAKASLDQARATLEQAKAEVARQQARYSVSRANLARIRPLAEQNAVSKKDLDDAIGQEESNHAAVLEAQAGVVAAQAAEGVAKSAVDKAS